MNKKLRISNCLRSQIAHSRASGASTVFVNQLRRNLKDVLQWIKRSRKKLSRLSSIQSLSIIILTVIDQFL